MLRQKKIFLAPFFSTIELLLCLFAGMDESLDNVRTDRSI